MEGGGHMLPIPVVMLGDASIWTHISFTVNVGCLNYSDSSTCTMLIFRFLVLWLGSVGSVCTDGAGLEILCQVVVCVKLFPEVVAKFSNHC